MFDGDANWQSIQVAGRPPIHGRRTPPTFAIRRSSVRMKVQPDPVQDIKDARILAILADSVTTDHISPAGNIKRDSPAGRYLSEHGVARAGL